MRRAIIVAIALSLFCAPSMGQMQTIKKAAPKEMTDLKKNAPISADKVQETKPKSDFLAGEVPVVFEGNTPLVKLGLVENGVLVIEFPENDFFFRWHGGNSNMVYIDDSPSKR